MGMPTEPQETDTGMRFEYKGVMNPMVLNVSN